MRKITDIYEEYKIMPNLQMHQLRVAAVAKQICESLNIEIDTESIIKACLFHDMGNIIKADLGYFPKFIESGQLEYWQKVKNEFINKYGGNEHEATVEIIREIGLPQNIIRLSGENRFSYLCRHRDSDDIYLKIIHYSDGRVGPHGILSFIGRMDEAGKRYVNRKNSIEEEERQKLINCGRDIEKQIFSHSNIRPDDINDESVKRDIELLRNFEI